MESVLLLPIATPKFISTYNECAHVRQSLMCAVSQRPPCTQIIYFPPPLVTWLYQPTKTVIV